MTRVIVDAATRDKLQNTSDLVEVCDESGKTLGYFYQAMSTQTPLAWRSPYSEEEIQRRRQEKSGRPLADILKDLGAT
jgi:hypothetical protein